MTASSESAAGFPLGAPLDNARYRHLVEQSGDMISTHRPGDWAYTTVNPALVEVCGYSADELLGRPAYDFFHPDDEQAMKRRMIPAVYQHGVRTFRYRSRHKNGRYFWLESTHRSIRDPESHELVEIIAVTRDITPQVKAEGASQRLAQVVEASADLVMFCDSNLTVNYMNGSALAGFNLASCQGQTLKALLSDKSYRRLREQILPKASAEGAWRGGLHLKASVFGQRFMVLSEVLTHPPLEALENQDEYSLIVRDITRLVLAERESRQHQTELAHANRVLSLGEMATGLAHEINQPLATTLNYASGASRQIESGKITDVQALAPVLVKIAQQAQRAAGIVKRLRALVRKTPYQRIEFPLNPVCEDVVEFIRHDLLKSGVRVKLNLASDELLIEADRIQIEQVLVNLLRNAMDAYEEGVFESPLIELHTGSQSGMAQIQVIDFGPGIESGYIDRLFQPYVTSKPKGLGMGLSITRTIVETHGGTIEVESALAEKGRRGRTTFTVSLPLLRIK
mgnify:FL=1